MLKLPYLFENYALAKECLTLYDPDEGSLDRFLCHFRISSNAVYPFRAKDKTPCVLRLSPVEEKPSAEVAWEARLIEWLNTQNFPAMKLRPTTDGRRCAVLETAWGTYNVSCFGMVDGDTLEDCDGSPELARGYGKTLGHLHRLLKDCPFAEERRDHAALMAEAARRFAAYGAPPALKAEWEAVNTALAALPQTPDLYGLVHYDFEADNVLYCEETGAFGVIDFDDAIRCWYALDVARAVDCLDDVAGEEDLIRAADAFFAGYREECPFSAETLLPLMRRLVRLQEYGTILHVLSEPVADAPDWMDDIVKTLRERLAEIEQTLQ